MYKIKVWIKKIQQLVEFVSVADLFVLVKWDIQNQQIFSMEHLLSCDDFLIVHDFLVNALVERDDFSSTGFF